MALRGLTIGQLTLLLLYPYQCADVVLSINHWAWEKPFKGIVDALIYIYFFSAERTMVYQKDLFFHGIEKFVMLRCSTTENAKALPILEIEQN